MLGRREFALRQGFACGKTLVRRKGAASQKAGWMFLKKIANDYCAIIGLNQKDLENQGILA